VRRLLEDASLCERLTQGARRRLETQFSLPRAVEQVEALLERVAWQAGRRPAQSLLLSERQP
jgi:hypothetical protein